MPSIKDWLHTATEHIEKAGSTSARLDAELILAHTLRLPRTGLHAHNSRELSEREEAIADSRLSLRVDRVPIAYIIGHKEFYGRRFKVTTATLIPRPESEILIELLKEAVPKNASLLPEPLRLVDVGTGSGCLGITAKLEHPELFVTLTDISRHALTVAEHNAKHLGAEVTTVRGDLLSSYPFVANIIIANLPYVDPTWERSPETDHEPAGALFASQGGLDLIFKLLDQTETMLVSGGSIILEADPEQHDAIIKRAKEYKLLPQSQKDYGLLLTKL